MTHRRRGGSQKRAWRVRLITLGVLAVACTPSSADDRDAADTGVTERSQFLSACSETCPAPLGCACGVCTVACADDSSCARYSAKAACVLPPEESRCSAEAPACDVPCTHDQICEPLGAQFVCVVGRCRHELADAGVSDPRLEACAPHAPVAGLCALSIDGSGGLTNEGPPLSGTILAIGDAEARPECFGSDNFGSAIPVAAHAGEAAMVPDGTVWWRVQGDGATYVVGLAAPGLDALGVAVGDGVTVRNAVSWGGWDWPYGNAEVDIPGRGSVLIAINSAARLDVSDGPPACELPGPCGGQVWSMRIGVDGETVVVPPYESVRVGTSLFTNSGALTHRPEYQEPGEATEGTPGCKGEPRTNFLATRVSAP